MIKVDTVCMEAQVHEMQRIADELNNIISRVDNVNRNLRWNTNISSQVRTRLANHNRGIANLDEKAARLAKVLNVIAAEYVQTENKVKNFENVKEGFSSDYTIMDWFREHNLPVIVGPDGKPDIDLKEWFEDIVIDKAVVIPAIMAIVSPAAGLAYITSGMFKGDKISVINPDRKPYSGVNGDWLGYEFSEDNPGVSAWIGKIEAKAENEWGYAEVEGTLGKAEAEVKGDVDFWSKKTKKEYMDGKWTEKTSVEVVDAEIKAGAGVNGAAANAGAGVGTDMLGLEGKAEGSVGNAKVEGKGKFSVGEDGVNANLQGEAMVSAVEGEASGTINILGIEITGKIGGYAGAAGVEGKVGVEDNKFVCEGGLAAIFGVSAGVEIGFNEEGWDNFVDAIIFWD